MKKKVLQDRLAPIRKFFRSQFVKFIIVGFFNSLFGYGCFAIFLYAGIHYTQAVLLATILGVIFNFKSIGTLVFRSKNNRLILRFACSYVIVYMLNIAGIYVFSQFDISPYISGAILIMPLAIIAFILNKRFVFNYGQDD